MGKANLGLVSTLLPIMSLLAICSSQQSDPTRLIKKIRRQFDLTLQQDDASMYDPYGGTLQIFSNTDPETGITYISSLNRNPRQLSQNAPATRNRQENSRKKRKPNRSTSVKPRSRLTSSSDERRDLLSSTFSRMTKVKSRQNHNVIQSRSSFVEYDSDSNPTDDLLPASKERYPRLSRIPHTGFKCSSQRYPGYYADSKTGCQVFHICQADGRQDSILCPNSTLFNQKYFTCDWWYNVDCGAAESFYELNANLYQEVNALDDEVDDVDKYFVSGSSYGQGQGYKIFQQKPSTNIVSNMLGSGLWGLRNPR